MCDAFLFFYGRQQLPDNKMANDDRLANNSRVLIILNASMKRHTIKRTFISCKLHGGASFTVVADRMTSVVKNAGAMSATSTFRTRRNVRLESAMRPKSDID
jgi:hypothetical protein